MYHDFAKLPDELSSIPEAGVEVLCLEHGLISFSYHNNTGSLRNDGAKSLEVFNEDVHNEQIKDTRIIMYPASVNEVRNSGLEVPSYTGTVGLLFSEAGSLTPIFDLERNRLCAWRSQFPKHAKNVVDMWMDVGQSLESVSYRSASRYNLYFPSSSV